MVGEVEAAVLVVVACLFLLVDAHFGLKVLFGLRRVPLLRAVVHMILIIIYKLNEDAILMEYECAL